MLDTQSRTEKWSADVVIDCGLCPFAAKPFSKGSINYRVKSQLGLESAPLATAEEMRQLSQSKPIETTLIVFENSLFDIWASTLPEHLKQKIALLDDESIPKAGVINIKSQSARNQLQNKLHALSRFNELLAVAQYKSKRRVATRLSKGTIKARLDKKNRVSKQKKLHSQQIDLSD